MKYLRRTDIREIIGKYEKIIAWGTGPIFKMNYKKNYFPITYLIDGTGKEVGKQYNGIEIKDEYALSKEKGRILIVIYTIYEKEVLNQIKKYDKGNIDIIIYSLIEIILKNNVHVPEINGKSCEDLLLMCLIGQLHLEDVYYLEIGVCHPIMRNNTYMLYEQFSSQNKKSSGVLVEANPICWPLIEEYRPVDKLIKAGITANGNNSSLNFYMFPHLLGHSTFSKKIADEKKASGYEYEVLKIPVKTINDVIIENFDRVPDVLALDAEGLDFEILMSWDYKKFPFKIVVSEAMGDFDKSIDQIMQTRGYKQYAQTIENSIWINKEYKLFI